MMTEKSSASCGKESERIHAECGEYIAKQIPERMELGISMTDIQNAVRDATDVIPQTHAPDAEGEYGNEIYGPVTAFTFFIPFDKSPIDEFAKGTFTEEELAERILSVPEGTPIGMVDGLELILTEYGKYPEMENVTGGGEVVERCDGEAAIMAYVETGHSSIAAEPMVFKTDGEVRTISESLDRISETDFRKKANIKKLMKSGGLDDYDPCSVKENAGYIIDMLWGEFEALRDIYGAAAGGGKGMLIFTSYARIPKTVSNNIFLWRG